MDAGVGEARGYGGLKGIVNIGAIRGGLSLARQPDAGKHGAFFSTCAFRQRFRCSRRARRSANWWKIFANVIPQHGIDWESYVSVPGAEIQEGHELIQAIDASHKAVKGTTPERGTVLWSSDASVMTRYGIATVNYGPSSGPRDARR